MVDVLARFLLRSGASALWTSVNPVLAAGEPAYEADTKILRIGDGVTAYTSLPRISAASELGQSIISAADAAAAQTAMGGTSVGRGVFTAADAAAAQTAIGASTTGKAVLVAANAAAARTAIGAVIGTDVQAYAAILSALAALASNGMVARTGAGTLAARTLTAGTGISISNADGVSGDPTISATTTTITPNMLDLLLGGGSINSTGTTFTALNCFALMLVIGSNNDTSTGTYDWEVRFSNDGGATFGAWQVIWHNQGGTTSTAYSATWIYLDIGPSPEYIQTQGENSGSERPFNSLTHPGGTINAIGIRTSNSGMDGIVKIFGIGTEA